MGHQTLQIGMGWLPEQPGSGLDRVYHALVQHLPEAGVHVDGLVVGSPSVRSSSGGQVQAVASESVILPKRLWAFRQGIRRALRAHSPDLVAGHFALYALPALDALKDIPFVMHFHGPWAYESEAEDEPDWKVHAKAALESMVYRHANRFVVLSAAFRDVLVNRYNVSAERVHIVPGGVNINRFATSLSPRAAREQLGWPTDRPIVLSVRRLVRRVGLDRLINAIDLVRREVPDVLLLIAGKGPLRDELTQQIRDHGLTDHARLLGFIPDSDLPLAYRAADLSVVPTVAHEGFGLVVVESLAAGTPAIVTPVGGLPEIVSDLSDALLLSDGRPATIASRVQQALKDKSLLPDATRCQKYAREHYDWAVVARQVRSVYEELL